VPHPSKSTRHPEVPEITLLGVNKFDADGKLNEAIYRRGAEGWHTDGAYDADPFKATQLYALAIPSTGGSADEFARGVQRIIESNREPWDVLSTTTARVVRARADDLHEIITRSDSLGPGSRSANVTLRNRPGPN